MSRTDKSIPYHVWAEQNPTGWNRKYAKMMYLFPRPKREQIYRKIYNGKERGRILRLRREVIKTGSYDGDFQNFSTRHSTLWNTY